jgi:chemotaxis protein MotB
MSDCECVEIKCQPGIPAWVMTFADLMSLLLAFFVLLFSFSEMDKNVYKELAGSLKDAFGVQNEIKLKDAPKGINIIAREFSPGRPQPTPENVVRQMTTDDLKLHPVFTDPSESGQENTDKKSEDADHTLVDTNAKLTDDEIEQIERVRRDSKLAREVFDTEITQGLIDLEVTQKRIILRVREKGSFPSGSADLIEPFKVVTNKISKVFRDFNGTIIISGHTDNIPIHTYRYRSNWELSSSRAVSVIHELVKDHVLMEKRFEIAAYADTQPIDTNNTATARAKNRRVEIIMDYSKNKADKKTTEDDANLLNETKFPETKS